MRQPSISNGIRELERAVGGALFERGSPARLTALGIALQPLFAEMRDCFVRVQETAQTFSAPLPTSTAAIGASEFGHQ